MDLAAKLKEEIEKKRKASEPLRELVAASSKTTSDTDAPITPSQEKKKKVYLTNGSRKKLEAELSVRVGWESSSGLESVSEEREQGPLSPEQISAQKSAIEGKKAIPKTEIFKRLRFEILGKAPFIVSIYSSTGPSKTFLICFRKANPSLLLLSFSPNLFQSSPPTGYSIR